MEPKLPPNVVLVPGGFYHAIFGVNPNAPVILSALGLQLEDFGRFRDAFVTNGDIAVYTRLGGGNRHAYVNVFAKMQGHPNYIRDVDDAFDSTYCTFYFTVPDTARNLLFLDIGDYDPSQRWRDALDAMRQPGYVPPPAVTEVMKDLLKKIQF